MAKKDKLEQINFYEINTKLLAFMQRAISSDINQAQALRAEVLNCIFSIDILKEVFIERSNNTYAEIKEQEKSKFFKKISNQLKKRAVGSQEYDYEQFLYFPSVFDGKKEIIPANSLYDFYKSFCTDLFFWPLEFPYIAYYIMSLDLSFLFVEKDKFNAAYLNSVILSVIKSLSTYIEYKYIMNYYSYPIRDNKQFILCGIVNHKDSDQLIKICKKIIECPGISMYQLATYLPTSETTLKRRLQTIARFGGTKGILAAAKLVILFSKLTAEEMDRAVEEKNRFSENQQ